jgi:hypothetical protein
MWHVWGKERRVQGFSRGNLRERYYLKDLDVDGSIKLKRILQKSFGRAFMGKPEGKDLLGRRRLRWDSGIKWILQKLFGRTWSGLIWQGIGIIGKLLCICLWVAVFRKMWQTS